MKSVWSALPWIFVLAVIASCFWRFKLLRWFLGKCSRFKAVEEGVYVRSTHICQSYRLDLIPPFGKNQSDKRKICCRYIYLKRRAEDKDSDEKICMVRNVCLFPYAPGERIRVSCNGSGRYKVEKI